MPLGAPMNDVNILKSIIDLTRKVESFQVDINSINSSINRYNVEIESLSNRTDIPKEFNDLKNKLEDHLIQFNGIVVSINSFFNEIRKRIASQKEDIEENSKKTEVSLWKFNEIEKSIEDTRRQIIMKNEAIMREFTNKLNSFSDAYLKEISSLRSDVMISPKSILDSNNSILKKLEIAQLEGNNATLKVNNIDLNVRVLEKKLENLSLQCKKIELSKQEG
jgi:hypothetical protein